MATVTFTYDHSRDPMHPGDLADKIAAALAITPPVVDINQTQIVATGTGVTEGNRAAIQTVINAYVLDPVRAKLPDGNEGTLLAKAAQALVTNAAYLALPDPTAANTAYRNAAALAASPTLATLTAYVRLMESQIKALSQQNNALIGQVAATSRQNNTLIRLVTRALDDVSGT